MEKESIYFIQSGARIRINNKSVHYKDIEDKIPQTIITTSRIRAALLYLYHISKATHTPIVNISLNYHDIYRLIER